MCAFTDSIFNFYFFIFFFALAYLCWWENPIFLSREFLNLYFSLFSFNNCMHIDEAEFFHHARIFSGWKNVIVSKWCHKQSKTIVFLKFYCTHFWRPVKVLNLKFLAFDCHFDRKAKTWHFWNIIYNKSQSTNHTSHNPNEYLYCIKLHTLFLWDFPIHTYYCLFFIMQIQGQKVDFPVK